MKKLKLLMLITLIVCCMGCQENAKPVQLHFTYSYAKSERMECILEGLDDTLKQITIVVERDLSVYSLDEIERIRDESAEAIIMYGNIEGVTYSVKEEKDIYVENIVLDATKPEGREQIIQNFDLESTEEISLQNIEKKLISIGWVY